jgi:multicomponent Na+:H+ antiporter subunit B
LKVIILIFVILSGGLLLYGTMDMPAWGDPQSPANSYVSPRYIEEALEKTETPNIVSAVLADYRGYDTMGETTVIFTAALVCALLLRKNSDEDET